MNIRVSVIEPNLLEREYLLALISGSPALTLVGANDELATALPQLQKDTPDVVVADLSSADHFATTWLKQVHVCLPFTSVLVLSTAKGREELFELLEAGVSGWIQKPFPAEQVLQAIVVLYQGGAVLSSSVARQILQYFRARGTFASSLSRREREVLILLGQGFQTTGIAAKLDLSPATVRTHFRNLLQKLQVDSRAEAVAKYLNPSGQGCD